MQHALIVPPYEQPDASDTVLLDLLPFLVALVTEDCKDYPRGRKKQPNLCHLSTKMSISVYTRFKKLDFANNRFPSRLSFYQSFLLQNNLVS